MRMKMRERTITFSNCTEGVQDMLDFLEDAGIKKVLNILRFIPTERKHGFCRSDL